MDLDSEWDAFLVEESEPAEPLTGPQYLQFQPSLDTTVLVPKASPIYISTKTKIAYLNQPINLAELFWNIEIMNYHEASEGVIKKQMKFICHTSEELEQLQSRLKSAEYLEQLSITSIDNPEGRIKFKDVRKISIGINKKDILSYRCKKKSAFYNCFVLILRILFGGTYHEIHIKVFNTGKLEIPGIKDAGMLSHVLDKLVTTFRPFLEGELVCMPEIYTVLINSNFSCGFYINRARLFEIIQYKYKISSVYDPCSYPGIQSKFYYDTSLEDDEAQTGQPPAEDSVHTKKVSFMIFRTGSVLIVGKCDEGELNRIYLFLSKMLSDEYAYIVEDTPEVTPKKSEKVKKPRKKLVTIRT